MPSNLEMLQRFHERHAGASDTVFGLADTGDGRTSYVRLADAIGAGPIDVLDLACGDGPLLEILHRRGLRAVGLDRSEAELSAARRRLGPAGPVLHHGLAEALPFRDASFEAVTCHMALMLMDEPQRVVAEVRRVLRPGGAFAAVVGARHHEPPPPEMEAVFEQLRALWRREHTPEVHVDPAFRDADSLRALLAPPAWTACTVEPYALRQQVPVRRLASFLEVAYYRVDALSDEGKAELLAFIAERFAERFAEEEGTVPWMSSVLLVRAEAA